MNPWLALESGLEYLRVYIGVPLFLGNLPYSGSGPTLEIRGFKFESRQMQVTIYSKNVTSNTSSITLSYHNGASNGKSNGNGILGLEVCENPIVLLSFFSPCPLSHEDPQPEIPNTLLQNEIQKESDHTPGRWNYSNSRSI